MVVLTAWNRIGVALVDRSQPRYPNRNAYAIVTIEGRS